MTLATAALGLMAALPAAAATVSVLGTAPASWNAVDPSQSLAITGTWTDAPAIVSGSVSGQYKSPFDPAGSGAPAGSEVAGWQQIQYWTIGSPNPNLAPSPAIMTFSAVQSAFTILWGSVDTYNAIQFVRNGVVVGTVTGQDVINEGGAPLANGAALVRITSRFDEIRMFSNFPNLNGPDTAAFEFSHAVAAVPLPAGGLLLIGALGGLALLRRRKTA